MGNSHMYKGKKLMPSLVFLLGGMLSFSSFAGEFTSYPLATDYDGHYSLSWDATPNEPGWELFSFEVREYVDGVYTGNVATSGTTVNLTGKSPGNYRYDLSIEKRIFQPGDSAYDYKTSVEHSISFDVGIATPLLSISPGNATYDGDYHVSWAAVVGATTYKLEERANNGAWTVSQNNSQVVKSFTNVSQGNYTYRVTACSGSSCSQTSSQKSIDVAYIPDFTHSPSTHNTITGDFDGNGEQDAFYQPLTEGVKGGILPLDLVDDINANLHTSWTITHPHFSEIEDWSAESYKAISGNFNSNPGDELLLLGNKNIILLHGDVITPITIFPPINNAIVSWNVSNNASYSEFQFDANPADYEIHVGNLDSDSYDEIFLQAKSKGNTSYILDSDGSLLQTISNGFLNAEWSAESYAVSLANQQIIMTALTSLDDNNVAHTNSSGIITHFSNSITKPTLTGTPPSQVLIEQFFEFQPDFTSTASSNTFTATGLPGWMSLNSSTGLLSGTPSAGDSDITSNITLTITENKSHTVKVSTSFSIEVVGAFSIVQTEYDVHEASDGTIYLVSKTTSDVYKVVKENNGYIVLLSSLTEFNSDTTELLAGYQTSFVDQDADGAIDLVLTPAENSDNDTIVLGDINGNVHTVVIENSKRDIGNLTMSVSEIADATKVTLTRPESSDVVGTIQSSAKVTNGKAAYNVPIKLPLGRRGVQPGVAINYSSSGGNGKLGIGWYLQATSEVSRCPASWAEDNDTGRVDLESDDRLCLDGSKLILVSGSYGAQNSEYRTREDSFRKITLLGGSFNSDDSYFKVIDKSGRESYYGETSNSRFIPSGRLTPLKWGLEKVWDNSVTQNNIIYEYSSGGNELLLENIYYTGTGAIAGSRKVHFDYETRDDKSFQYIAGGTVSSSNRLTAITTSVAGQNVDKYYLNYENNLSSVTHRSRLESIEHCGFETIDETTVVERCLPKRTFSYSGQSQSFEQVESTNEIFNSDVPYSIANQLLGDFNNDGILDLVRHKMLHLMSIQNNQLVFDRVIELPFNAIDSVDPNEQLKLGQLDFDGDGQQDIIGVTNSGLTIASLNSTQDGFVEYHLGISMTCSVAELYLNTFTGPIQYSYDYKHAGACRAEAIPDNAGGFYLFHKSSPTPSSTPELKLTRINKSCTDNVCSTQTIAGIYNVDETYTTADPALSDFRTLDFDGDGDPDLVRLEKSGENVSLKVVTNNQVGAGPNAVSTFVTSEIELPEDKDFAMGAGGHHWMDANGDGLKDLLIFDETWKLYVNEGGEFASVINTGIGPIVRGNDYLDYNFPFRADYTTHGSIRIVDFNGDGLDDFMFLDREVNTRDCFADRRRSFCKEGNGSESAGPADFSVTALAHGKYSVYLSSINGTDDVDFELQQTDITGTMSYFYPMDIDSDGLLDFIGAKWYHDYTITDQSQESNSTKVYLHYGKIDNQSIKPDLLLVAQDDLSVDSFGTKDEFEYKSYIKHRIDNHGTSLVDNSDLSGGDYYRIPSTMMVATKHSMTNVLGTENSKSYEYTDPVFHQAGLGFLGFETIKEIDSTLGVTAEAFYRMDYPLNGRMTSSKLTENSDGTLLKEEVLTWCDLSASECDGSSGGVYFVHLNSKYTQYFDTDGHSLKQERTDFDGYDVYGNITDSTVTLTDSTTTHKTVVKNTYLDADESNWWVNKLDKTVTTKTVTYTDSRMLRTAANNAKTLTRKVTWKEGNARQLATETISANDTGLSKVMTYHSYDSYGNLTKVENDGSAIENVNYTDVQHSLIKEFDYSDYSGYFINSESNGVWNADTMTRTWDIFHGKPLTEKDVNDNQVTSSYDSFGRLISSGTNLTPTKDIIFEWCDSSCAANAVYQVTYIQDGAPTVVEQYNRANQILLSSIESMDTSANQIESHTSYDELGRVLKQTVPAFADATTSGYTEYKDYDVLGRPGSKVTSNAPQSYTATYTYTGVDTSISVNGGSDGTLTMARQYNFLNQLMQSTDALENKTYNRYDPNGNAILIEDANGNKIHAVYDAFSHKLSFDDPNNGIWNFRYNALGQVRWQRDANLTEVRMDYDNLGRAEKRYIDNLVDATWLFDTRILGAVTSESRHNLQKDYYYDAFGRITKESSVITHSGTDRQFDFNYAYDDYYGRIKGLQYPTGEIEAYQYDKFGYLTKNVDPNNQDEVLRQINAISALGKVTSQKYLNGLNDTRIFKVSGEFEKVCVQQTSSCGGTGEISQIYYDGYDNFGNLTNRQDLYKQVAEHYNYDDLHRITSATRSYTGWDVPVFSPSESTYYDYDELGNLLYKTDYASAYSYSGGTSGGPNAVKSITNLDNIQIDFSYDDNGNMIQGDGMTLTYDGFNKPITIIHNQVTSTFEYGADDQRYLQVLVNGNKTTTTYYVDKRFEEVQINEGGSLTTEKRHYLSDYAVLTHTGNKKTLNYLHGDRLGSTYLITKGYRSTATILSINELEIERRSYDVFGKPRDGLWGDSNQGKLLSEVSTRGFTSHEHLDDVELIHMNGRAFDYNLGRFLSVDPFIQLPESSQSINAYSYLMNNPLAGTDPSGYVGDTMLESVLGGSPVWRSDIPNDLLSDLQDNNSEQLLVVGSTDESNASLTSIDSGTATFTARKKPSSVDDIREIEASDWEKLWNFLGNKGFISDQQVYENLKADCQRNSGSSCTTNTIDMEYFKQMEKLTPVLGAAGIGTLSASSTRPWIVRTRVNNIDDTMLYFTDAMNDKHFTRLVKNIDTKGLKNPVIKYVTIGGENFIVLGNNRVLAARHLKITDQLVFKKVKFPVKGTNFNTPKDVLDTIGNVRLPRYRGRRR